eukprot:TRINITY_DN6647_c0_g1_i1.p1 TRINITY_DN6647_c0_g1~~TRINITY_DN6647_c0_g1_i1.p1  ORF type:complete len:503 (-),score=78.60 TRINITY_DN6647_c0_g1_i1:148-1548(-)
MADQLREVVGGERHGGRTLHIPSSRVGGRESGNSADVSPAPSSHGDNGEGPPVRGVYNLVGVTIGMAALFMMIESYSRTGVPFSVAYWSTITSHPGHVALCFMGMVLWSFTAYLHHKIFVLGYVTRVTSDALFQASMCLLVMGTIRYIQTIRFLPVTCASLMVELVVLTMKMHSYYMVNRACAEGDGSLLKFKESLRVYPHNVTIRNYIYYLLAPTLVYEPIFQRTDRVRVRVVVEKLLAMVGCSLVLYLLLQFYIQPAYEKVHELSFVLALAKLSLPAVAMYLTSFYVVFDCVLGGLAEVLRFKDRQFYLDWWNTTHWEEYARKWNRPVHKWLSRHLYQEHSIRTGRFSQVVSLCSVYLFSALMHEFILAISFGVFRFWTLAMMILQSVIIFLSHLPILRSMPQDVQNILFWMGLFIGWPLLNILYAYEYHTTSQTNHTEGLQAIVARCISGFQTEEVSQSNPRV